MIAAVEMLADHVVEWHLLGPDHVSQPHFVGLHSNFASDGIHDHFDCEADARSCDAAVGNARTAVGRDGSRTTAIGPEEVRAGEEVGNWRGLRRRSNGIMGM